MKQSAVFVYGTLMREHDNYKRFLQHKKNVKFLGTAELKGYEMYHISNFPGIVPKKDASIRGEVFTVDSKTLKELDCLEGEGYMYQRVEEYVQLYDGKHIKAFVYVWLGSTKGYHKVTKTPWKAEYHF